VQVGGTRGAALIGGMRRGDGPGKPWLEAGPAEARGERIELAVTRFVDGVTEGRHVRAVSALDRRRDLDDGAT
jgi:hypothetical protein